MSAYSPFRSAVEIETMVAPSGMRRTTMPRALASVQTCIGPLPALDGRGRRLCRIRQLRPEPGCLARPAERVVGLHQVLPRRHQPRHAGRHLPAQDVVAGALLGGRLLVAMLPEQGAAQLDPRDAGVDMAGPL